MRYFGIRLKQKQEEEQYRTYVTDGLYALTNKGQRLGRRFADIIDPNRNQVEETRTPDEIINAISKKLERMAG